MTPGLARLIFPALRADADGSFSSSRAQIDQGLALGVGGFIIFGGGAEQVRELTTELQMRSKHPLLIGADLERGAGQQYKGATPLPPLAAFGFLDDELLTERAGQLTALEARALGVNWIYAPVADIDLEPTNPIVGTRAFGIESERVANHVTAWIRGCHLGHALCCTKHFPGHGRTVTDSHAELPEVTVDAAALDKDLVPFKAAIKADVDAIMSAHVRYPAFDVDGHPATLSHRIITGLLRERLDFAGLVVTDAINMGAVQKAGADEPQAAVMAIAAGCDALLYPTDMNAVVAALDRALGNELTVARVQESVLRIDQAARRPGPVLQEDVGRTQDRSWSVELGARAIHTVRGTVYVGKEIDLYVVDDDLGGPFPAPSRQTFIAELEKGGVRVNVISEPVKHCVVAAFCDIRGWKGRHGFSDESIARINAAVEQGAHSIILFGHPRLAGQIKGADVLCAWGGEPLMQEAAAFKLIGQQQ